MRWFSFAAMAALVGIVGFPAGAAVGTLPRYVEEIVIGGGPDETVNGGLEIDKSGNLETTGYLWGASVRLTEGANRVSITAPALTADRAVTFPDADGEVTLLGQTITSGEISGELTDAQVSDTLTASIFVGSGSTSNAVDLDTAEVDGLLGLDHIDTTGADVGDVPTFDGTNIVWSPGGTGTVGLEDITQSGASVNQAIVWGGSGWGAVSLGDAHISDTLTIGASSTVADAALSANVAHVNAAETLSANWVNTANPWADNEVSDTLTASIFVGSGSTSNAVDLATAEVSGLLGLDHIATTGGINGDVLTLVAGAVEWETPGSGGGIGDISGPGPLLDNAIPRMDGAGGYTLQGYVDDANDAPTVSDLGLVTIQGAGLLVDGGTNVTFEDTAVSYGGTFVGWMRDDATSGQLRFITGLTPGAETGTLGESDLYWTVYDNTGSESHTALIIRRNPALGIEIAGTGGVPRDLHVDGNYYTDGNQLTSSGKVLLSAIGQGGASVGQVPEWNGSVWVPSTLGSGNVSNSGSGTDNRFPRFHGNGTTLQDGQTTEDDSGNVNITGTITAGSGNTVLTSAAGELLDAAMSANVAHLNAAETIASNWVNTANPWADNEVVDALTISGGTVNNSVIGGSTPAAGTFTSVTSTGNFNSTATAQTFIYNTPTSGGASIRLNPLPFDTSSTAQVDLFRQTNTTAAVRLAAYRGNNSATEIWALTAGSSPTTSFKDSSGVQRLLVTHSSGLLEWEGSTDNAFETTLGVVDPTGDNAILLPNQSGTVALTSDLAGVPTASVVSVFEDFVNEAAWDGITANDTVYKDIWFGDAGYGGAGTGGGSLAGQNGENGVIKLAVGAANNDLVTLAVGQPSTFLPFQAGDTITGEVKITAADLTNSTIIVGFSDATLTDVTLTHADGATFRSNAALGSTWTTDAADGTTGNADFDCGDSATAAHTLKIVMTSTLVTFYIDGVLQTTYASNIPGATEGLWFGVEVLGNSAFAAGYIDIDYISVSQTRG